MFHTEYSYDEKLKYINNCGLFAFLLIIGEQNKRFRLSREVIDAVASKEPKSSTKTKFLWA